MAYQNRLHNTHQPLLSQCFIGKRHRKEQVIGLCRSGLETYLLLSILHMYGIPQEKIGTSTGPLQPLEIV